MHLTFDHRHGLTLRDPVQGRPTLNEDALHPLGSFLWYQTSISTTQKMLEPAYPISRFAFNALNVMLNVMERPYIL